MSDVLREAAVLVAKAGMSEFVPHTRSYIASVDPLYESKVIQISEIKPFERAKGVANFGEGRALSILSAIASNLPIPPVRVECLEAFEQPYVYRLHDGFHRFHLSQALGFTHLPVGVMDTPLNFNAET